MDRNCTLNLGNVDIALSRPQLRVVRMAEPPYLELTEKGTFQDFLRHPEKNGTGAKRGCIRTPDTIQRALTPWETWVVQ